MGQVESWFTGPRLFLLLALTVTVYVPLAHTDAPQDDAYISYRYAQNWANGDGLVFNAGEQPVEGYTNFLWTVLIGMGMRLGVNPELLGPLLGLMSTLGVAFLTARLTLALGGSNWFAAAAVLLFAVQPALRVHAASGLETSFFALLLLGGLLPRLRSVPRPRDDAISGLCLAAAALTRPEGILIFGLLELADAAVALRGPEPLRSWLDRVLRRALPFGFIVGLHLVWRRATYGGWVPNTFHAKVVSGFDVWTDGLQYATAAVFAFGPILFLLPYFIAGLVPGRRARLFCLWISTVYTTYVIYVGGDYMPTFRFLMPILPLWCALAASSLSLVGKRLAWPSGELLAGVLLLLLGTIHTVRAYTHEGTFWAHQEERHVQLVAAGKRLDEILPAEAWIAATNAGRVPFFARRRCIDMTGLSDRHIASRKPTRDERLDLIGHLKGDGKYILDRRPDVIVFLRLIVRPRALARDVTWPRIVREQAFSISESEVGRDPRFRDYRMYSVPLPDVGAWMNFAALPGTLDDSVPEGLVEAPWPSSH